MTSKPESQEPSPPDKILKRLELSNDTELRLTQIEYKGTTYFDLRKYYSSPGGDILPTKKGVTLSDEQWGIVQGWLNEL